MEVARPPAARLSVPEGVEPELPLDHVAVAMVLPSLELAMDFGALMAVGVAEACWDEGVAVPWTGAPTTQRVCEFTGEACAVC